MNWLSIGKAALIFVAATGVSTVAGNIVKMTTPKNLGTLNKVLTVIGGVVISSMAGAAASQYVSGELDKAFPIKEDEKEIVPV